MTTDNSISNQVRCSQCNKLNRIDPNQSSRIWKCGACKAPLPADFIPTNTALPAKSIPGSIFEIIPLALMLLPVSIAAGFLDHELLSISQKLIHFQILIYPGMAAGALVGFIIVLFKRLGSIEPTLALTLAFCAGLVVFGSRWEIGALKNSPPLGAIEYLSKEAASESVLYFSGGHHVHGHGHMNPVLFWFLFVLEGATTVLATMRIANEAPL